MSSKMVQIQTRPNSTIYNYGEAIAAYNNHRIVRLLNTNGTVSTKPITVDPITGLLVHCGKVVSDLNAKFWISSDLFTVDGYDGTRCRYVNIWGVNLVLPINVDGEFHYQLECDGRIMRRDPNPLFDGVWHTVDFFQFHTGAYVKISGAITDSPSCVVKIHDGKLSVTYSGDHFC